VADTVQESIVIEADADTIMDFIADFEAYADWQDEVRDVEILEEDGDGWATRVRYLVDARILATEFVLEYTYAENEMRWRLIDSDKLRKNDGSYRLEKQGSGMTKVTYELEIEPAVPIPRMVRRQAAKRIVNAALHGMKQRIEASR
jgi:ribosome-associated toxin RatA of RatAB toxin-antitoxin module